MSHIDIDVIDFLLIAIYPAAGLFGIEMIFRVLKGSQWLKLSIQGFLSLAFGIAYLTLITAHWLTSVVLIALAIALFYQSKRALLTPGKSLY
ncbi:MAG: putative membrane protein [Cenarchaeum symbiont of Oopsacas minuta]|nr:putative membrane protein [Cenarchaeum symbiont of Oopsacas minuta]